MIHQVKDVNTVLNVVAKARSYRDELPKSDPARGHLSALLDVIAAIKSARFESEYVHRREIDSLKYELKQARDAAERGAGWDANGREVES